MNNNNVRIIAFYLPQYHTIPENDKWWGKGFTEWTNVKRARPLFKGHYQPRIPADELGYYNLLDPRIREKQAKLAKESGVYGFCYWHYWFGNGKQLLEKPFNEVLKSGSPDFPFCLGWANESWKAKQWKNGEGDKLLIEQQYLGEQDYKQHFEYLLQAFKDNRYIKVGNSPLFFIHRPLLMPKEIIQLWNKWAKIEGFDGVHFVARLSQNEYFKKKDAMLNNGYSAISISRLGDSILFQNKFQKTKRTIKNILRYNGARRVVDYEQDIKFLCRPEIDKQNYVYPKLYPNWDHSPRSKKRSLLIVNSTPELFKQHAKQILQTVRNKDSERRFVFLKSWNEWGEGNYMEPDKKFGKGYIQALRSALSCIDNS